MVPFDFTKTLARIHLDLNRVDGWLTDREVQFLALLAACPTAVGEILEIGSFRGRSTIALAHATALANASPHRTRSQLIAVDPLLDNDPLLSTAQAAGEALATFTANLRRAGVLEQVEFHRGYSWELARRGLTVR